MLKITRSRFVTVVAATLGALFLAWLAWPSAVPVDLATVSRGPMEVTVDEEARTRIHHIYTVSAPLTGTVVRALREVGDPVVANETVVAVMRPNAPSFHDPRLHQELLAALSAADAAVTLAEAEKRRIEAALNYSRTDFRRMEALARQGAVARSTFDKVATDMEMNEAALASATAELQVRRNERNSAAVRLQSPTELGATAEGDGCCIQIKAPVTGEVLKRYQESETVVPAGTPLVDLGDPKDLEVDAELLSTDAVQVRQGAPVHIDGWGGQTLRGRVRRVQPTGFLKVSALGIEEQRVITIIDFVDSPRVWRYLGHDYRVIVHIVVWHAADVLTVPIGALFRANGKWAVFQDVNGRARLTEIKIAHRNNDGAEVISGLSPGDQVVLHASDRVSDGTRIAQRQ